MNRKIVLVVCGLIILPLAGCKSQNRDKGGVEVIVEGGGEFPQFLAGTWQAETDGWEFTFEPNGVISTAVISLGRITMRPGEKTVVPMKQGGKGVFEPGEWVVNYAADRRELTVKLSLSNLYTKLGDDILEGKSNDVFVGKIDEDGKLWETTWTSFYDYTAHTKKYPNFKMSSDPNYGESKTLIFEKLQQK